MVLFPLHYSFDVTTGKNARCSQKFAVNTLEGPVATPPQRRKTLSAREKNALAKNRRRRFDNACHAARDAHRRTQKGQFARRSISE